MNTFVVVMSRLTGRTKEQFSKWVFIIVLVMNALSFAGYSANTQAQQQIIRTELVHSKSTINNRKTFLFTTGLHTVFLKLHKGQFYYIPSYLQYYNLWIKVKWNEQNRRFITVKERICTYFLKAIPLTTVEPISRFRN